jgi:hypothetical protein
MSCWLAPSMTAMVMLLAGAGLGAGWGRRTR